MKNNILNVFGNCFKMELHFIKFVFILFVKLNILCLLKFMVSLLCFIAHVLMGGGMCLFLIDFQDISKNMRVLTLF